MPPRFNLSPLSGLFVVPAADPVSIVREGAEEERLPPEREGKGDEDAAAYGASALDEKPISSPGLETEGAEKKHSAISFPPSLGSALVLPAIQGLPAPRHADEDVELDLSAYDGETPC